VGRGDGELVHNEFEDESPTPRTLPGPQAARGFFEALFAAFPDLTSTQHQLLADGDLAATRWTLTGTMTGNLWGMPATGKSVQVTGIDVLQIRDGKVYRDWGGMADQLPKIFSQIGVGG
jgi:predicted ester cyclase